MEISPTSPATDNSASFQVWAISTMSDRSACGRVSVLFRMFVISPWARLRANARAERDTLSGGYPQKLVKLCYRSFARYMDVGQ